MGRNLALEQGASNSQAVTSGITYILDNFTPVIMPGELIVGFNYADLKYNYFYYHQWPYCCLPQDTPGDRELLLKNNISQKDIDAFYRYLKQPQPCDLLPVNFTQQQNQASAEWASLGGCCDTNHSVIGYDQVLKYGFSGLLKRVEHYEKENGTNSMYQGMKQICRSALNMGKKYALLAQKNKAVG